MNPDASIDRFLMAIGGFIGFGGAFLSAIKMGGDDVSSALFRASIGMIVGAFLVKLLISFSHSLFKEARIEQIKAQSAKAPVEPEAEQGNRGGRAAR